MSIPDYQSLMLPVLELANEGETRISDAVDRISSKFGLTEDERSELLPSGKQTLIANRVHWAKTYLKQAALVEATKRAYFQITDRGKEVLESGVVRIDNELLSQFPEFLAFRNRTSKEDGIEVNQEVPVQSQGSDTSTPDDKMRAASRLIHDSLGSDMLERILTAPPIFFERLVVNLLLAMGYGGTAAEAGRAIGKSGDDGVDGVIDQDTLGLDRVYVQAKRYKFDSTVGAGAIRDFFGSLDMHKASKGLFVTTSSFTKAALETADKLGKRIVLIDGKTLVHLMIRFNVGCRVEENFEIKRIDEEFFET